MALLEKIRGMLKKEKETDANKILTLSFDDLSDKVDSYIKDHSKRTDKIKKDLDQLVKRLDDEVDEIIENLQSVDLKSKKEHEKVKHVVQENLNLYIVNLKRLLENLRNLPDLDIGEHIRRILRAFAQFEKSSHLPFQKATILIGDELEKSRLVIRKFSLDFNSLLKSNKDLFEEMTVITQVRSTLDEIQKIDASEAEINENINKLNDDVKENNEQADEYREHLETIHGTEDYKTDVLDNEKHKIELNYLEGNIQKIKEKMDLKKVAKYFHSDKKRSQLAASYMNDFKFAIKADTNLDIIMMVKEATGSELLELKGMREHIMELEEDKDFKSFKAISLLEDKIKAVDNKNDVLNIQINDEKKKIEKLHLKRDSLVTQAKKLYKSVFPNVQIT